MKKRRKKERYEEWNVKFVFTKIYLKKECKKKHKKPQ